MLFPLPPNVTPQSISAITAQIKGLLEANFTAVCVTGEVGSLTIPSSGHVYFNLKDKEAVLPAVMWKMTAQRHRYAIKEGQNVVVCGKLTVYPPHGKYQLTVDILQQAGAGAQDLAIKRLKEKLQKLGYFAPERKKRLPLFPRRLAIVTSSTGAAIRDMLEIATRRWPCCEIWICSVRVQGSGAAREIASALRNLNQHDGIDVILLGRGGGSSEDLAAFNDENVARAIFESSVPVISAVGHEIDITIADLVADRRAATPSEAAELATPDRVELLEALRARGQRLHDLLLRSYHAQAHRLKTLAERRVFRFPLDRVREREHRLDDWRDRLSRAMNTLIARNRQRLDAIAGKLHSLSPLNVLARGYSLTRTPALKVVRSVNDVKPGDTIEVVVADGKMQADVRWTSASEK